MGEQPDTEALKKAFGQRLRALRKKVGLSQMALGERAGLDYNYCGQVERGERNISLEAMGKLAQGLNIETVELFYFSVDHSSLLNPQLVQILTDLESEDEGFLNRVRDVIEVLLRWKRSAPNWR